MSGPHARDWHRWGPLLLVAAATVFLLAGLLFGANPDDEELRSAMLATWLHARALAGGVYPYWTSALGFGLPHPLVPAFTLDPVLPLFALLPPDRATTILYGVHAVVGVAGCWLLTRAAGAHRWAAALAAATWALASPSQNYVITDFWPAEFVGWSIAPWLLLTAMRLLEATSRRAAWRAGVAHGLVAGLMVANGHPGHVPVFFAALAAMYLATPARTWRVRGPLLAALAVGAAVAAPTLVHVITEYLRFPPLPRENYGDTMTWADLWDLFARPFPVGSLDAMMLHVRERTARVPFYGGPMAVLTLACLAGLGRRAEHRGLVVACVACAVLVNMPGLRTFEWLSATFLFRDPLILTGIVLGAVAWQRVASMRPRLAVALAVAQLAIMALATWPFVEYALKPSTREGAPVRLQLAETPLVQALHRHAATDSRRWYIAARLDALVNDKQMRRDGIGRNSLAFHGIPVANGLFKGVSVDPIHASRALPYGRVEGSETAAAQPELLDVLGIRFVLALADEPVAPTLRQVGQVPSTHGTVRILVNDTAWPDAVFVDPAVRTMTLPGGGCDGEALFCKDVASLAAARQVTDPVRTTREAAGLTIRVLPTAAERLLLVTEMFRPGWEADAAGHRARVEPLAGALVGVAVPPGVDRVTLTFRPPLRVWAVRMSSVTLVLALGFVLAGGRRPRRPSRSGADPALMPRNP